ncbi:histidine phosphatase superfamily branch 1 protein [Nitzschia inconspicua]|uniref:Histidine phosphatase superfamily branch 1 protein n=1 Tax=Nitzschia inconspicua TaxID=303405 RepID=A0A9K3KRF7_9STRA|nr:histidine phosphatase superfamily branch 1 protein [Nitzschia inconspicua]
MTAFSTVLLITSTTIFCCFGAKSQTSAFSNLPNFETRSCQHRLQTRPLQSSYAEYLESIPESVKEIARNSEPLVVEKMPSPLPENLRNKYYLLRHGQSTANIAEIISSSRSLAYSEKHGLTLLGYEQGRQSANQLLDVLIQEGASKGDTLVFVSSPFARARQTAEACLDGLKMEEKNQQRIAELELTIKEDIQMENGLMERYFGRLDFDRIYTYAYVWPMDAINTTHTAFGVESVAAVCTRLYGLVEQLESQYQGHHIVLVSHADVLQIAQLYGANAENVGTFSSYRFKNGEVRAMKRTPDSLPEPSPLEAPQRGTAKFMEAQSK